MRCRDAEHALARQLNERDPSLLPPALAAHLADCPTCQAEWLALQRVDRLFTQAPMLAAPAGFAAATLARLDTDAARLAGAPTPRWRRKSRRLVGLGLTGGGLLLWLGLAAGLLVWGLVILGLGFLAWGWLQSPQAVNMAQGLWQQVVCWAPTVVQALCALVGTLLPWLALGGLAFVLLSALAYGLTLAWAWLIGQVWWPGIAPRAEGGRMKAEAAF